MLRHLLTKVIPAAWVLNVVLNAVVGLIVFRAPVPLLGKGGVAGDTFVTAFLIGCFTFVGVVPSARKQALAGRLRGWGWPRLAIVHRHPIIGAVAVGVVASVGLAWPSTSVLAHEGVGSLSRHAMVLWRAGFSGLAGVLIAILATFVGVAPILPVGQDARWVKGEASGLAYLFDYIDKGALAISDRARGCSGTPTWQLIIKGALTPDELRVALADLVTRYPSLATRVQALDGAPPHATRYRYAADPAFSVDRIFHVVRAESEAELSRVLHEHHNRFLDQYNDFPVTLTMVETSADSCRLLFRQHHGIADGRAFIGLLADFAVFVNAARASRRPPAAALSAIGRRGEISALSLSAWQRAGYTILGTFWVIGNVLRAALSPPTPFAQNRSNDYRGDNGTVHLCFDEAVMTTWEAARKRCGVSLNSLLTAVLLLANQRWHRARGQALSSTRGTLVLETRPRGGSFVSFANHLATLDVDVDLSRPLDLASLARTIHDQVRRQRRRHIPEKRLLAERMLVSRMSIAEMQRFVFQTKRASYNFNFSNLIALEFAALGGEGWQAEEVLINTPVTPRIGMVLTVIRYRGRVVFNFNYKSSAISREETEALAGHFRELLDELAMTTGHAT